MNPIDRISRLKRLDQLFISHPVYFITANTVDRVSILANSKVHDNFKTFCGLGQSRGIFVGKYVLMPDHLHLFVTFAECEHLSAPEPRTQTASESGGTVAAGLHRRPQLLSDWMKSLKNSLSKALRTINIPAPHWQKGFFDHVMRSEESYSEKWLYVAQNPIRKSLVRDLRDWPYQREIHPLQARGHVE